MAYSVGDTVPEWLRVTPDKYLPHRYAGASGDFNPIHIDAEFAKLPSGCRPASFMASTRWGWWLAPTPHWPVAIHAR